MGDQASGSDSQVPATPEELRRRRQQLKSTVMAEPQRLDLREQLAAVYRDEGNASQAGRWNYLSESSDPAETKAFTRAFEDDPVAIMRALRWTGSEEDAATPLAQERLRVVRARARDRAGHSVSWEKPEGVAGPQLLTVLGCGAVVLIVALAVVGALSAVRWLIEVMQ